MVDNPPQNLPYEAKMTADDRGRFSAGSQFGGKTLQVRIEDAVDPLDLPVYFTRYKVNLSVAGKAAMLADYRAGMDHGTGPLDVSGDYDAKGKGAREDRDALIDIARNMGLLVAAPSKVAPDRVRIGPVPQQPILNYAYESTRRDHEEEKEIPEAPLSVQVGSEDVETASVRHDLLTQKHDTPRVYMKTIQMDPSKTVTVSKDEAPELFDLNSRPRNTIRRWHSKAEEVREAYRNATYPNPHDD